MNMSILDTDVGLRIKVEHTSIKGIVAAIPKMEIDNASFQEKFGETAVNEIVKMIGVRSRRQTSRAETSADLCQASAEELLKELKWETNTIDAIVFVSQTPDYRLPATACVLQHRLGLKKSCVAFDVNLGCSGYVYGLWLASKMIDGIAIKRVLLLVGDTISKVLNPDDRATALLFGDAGSATGIEFDHNARTSYLVLGTDGAGEYDLIVPEGAYRSSGNTDSDLPRTFLEMDGAQVFNFTLKNVPPLVNDLLAFSALVIDDISVFLFHQANQFMLKHIIKKLKLPTEKAPININKFGNTSSASIPLLVADADIKEQLNGFAVMTGFGVGYSWAAALVDLTNLKVNQLIEFESDDIPE